MVKWDFSEKGTICRFWPKYSKIKKFSFPATVKEWPLLHNIFALFPYRTFLPSSEIIIFVITIFIVIIVILMDFVIIKESPPSMMVHHHLQHGDFQNSLQRIFSSHILPPISTDMKESKAGRVWENLFYRSRKFTKLMLKLVFSGWAKLSLER